MTKAVVSICKATSFPPGISIVASNCYASSVLQCIFSHHTFREMITGIFATHSKYCSTCCKKKVNFLLVYVSEIFILVIIGIVH